MSSGGRTARKVPRGPHPATDAEPVGERHQLTRSDGRVRCFLMRGDARVREVCAGLNFAPSTWRDDMPKLIAAEALPLVQLPSRPDGVPAELADSEAGDRIVYRDAVHQFDIVTTREKAREIAQARVNRTAAGHLSAHEVAAEIAARSRATKAEAFARVLAAFEAGTLRFRDAADEFATDPERLAPLGLWHKGYVVAEIAGEVSAYTTVAEVNRWLEGEGVSYRLASAAGAAAAPVTSPPIGTVGGDGAADRRLARDAADSAESVQERKARRHDRFHELGGSLSRSGSDFKCAGRRGALARLAEEEKAAGRPCSDSRDVSREVREEAAQRRSGRALPTK